jgi:hypothetical protein
VGIRTEGYDFAFGAMGVLGRGEGLGVTRLADATPYRTRALTEATLMFFIAGGNHAVKRLARSISE